MKKKVKLQKRSFPSLIYCTRLWWIFLITLSQWLSLIKADSKQPRVTQPKGSQALGLPLNKCPLDPKVVNCTCFELHPLVVRCNNLTFESLRKGLDPLRDNPDGLFSLKIEGGRGNLTRGPLSRLTIKKFIIYNSRVGYIATDALHDMDGVETFEIEKTLLPNLENDLLQAIAPTVQKIAIVDSNLNPVPERLFSHMYLLKDLNLEGNGVNKVTGKHFFDLISLESLNLGRNSLGDFKDDVIAYNDKLHTLLLNDNFLTELNPEAFKGGDLKNLDLRRNKLKCNCFNIPLASYLMGKSRYQGTYTQATCESPNSLYGRLFLEFPSFVDCENEKDWYQTMRNVTKKPKTAPDPYTFVLWKKRITSTISTAGTNSTTTLHKNLTKLNVTHPAKTIFPKILNQSHHQSAHQTVRHEQVLNNSITDQTLSQLSEFSTAIDEEASLFGTPTNIAKNNKSIAIGKSTVGFPSKKVSTTTSHNPLIPQLGHQLNRDKNISNETDQVSKSLLHRLLNTSMHNNNKISVAIRKSSKSNLNEYFLNITEMFYPTTPIKIDVDVYRPHNRHTSKNSAQPTIKMLAEKATLTPDLVTGLLQQSSSSNGTSAENHFATPLAYLGNRGSAKTPKVISSSDESKKNNGSKLDTVAVILIYVLYAIIVCAIIVTSLMIFFYAVM